MGKRAQNDIRHPFNRRWDERPPSQSGLSWFYTAPQASYSSADIARILHPWLDYPTTMMRIRIAHRDGELHPYRKGVTNLFCRCEVSRFVMTHSSLTGGEKANAALESEYEDLCIPKAHLVQMLQDAAGGRWWQPNAVRDGDKGDGAGPTGNMPWVTPLGTRSNPKYPPPRTDAFMKTPPHLDNSVPGLRTRIKADSLRSKLRHARRKKEI
jgi:hypothetical protein